MIVHAVLEHREADLPLVGRTSDRIGLGLGITEGRKEHRNEHCNDADDHQQFDEAESAKRMAR